MKGERLELHRRMAGVVETSWLFGDIDRAIAGPAALAFLRTVVRGDGQKCVDPGMRRTWKMYGSRHSRARGLGIMHGSGHPSLGIPVRGGSQKCMDPGMVRM